MGLNGKSRNFLRIIGALLLLGMFFACFPVKAEYGDVVMNKQSEKYDARPVIFSHTFHRVRFRCKVCHAESGFKMRAGSNDMTMLDIGDGKFCGACHNDRIAWGVENCDLCHSGKPGLKSGVVGGNATGGPGRW